MDCIKNKVHVWSVASMNNKIEKLLGKSGSTAGKFN